MGNAQKPIKGEYIEGVIPGRTKKNNLNLTLEIGSHPTLNKQIEIDYSKLNKFMESYIIQRYLSKNKENSKDKVFNSLQELEKEELKKLFENKVKDYESKVLKGGKLKLNIENKIYNEISNIIKYENTEEIFKKKIIDEINMVKSDYTKFQIEHLTILLIGRKGVGKSTLIKYILKLNEDDDYYEDNNSQNTNFKTYTSKAVTHLKLVEFKGIGLDTGSDPELIGKEAVKCIMEEMKKNKEKNFIAYQGQDLKHQKLLF
jgi:ATPase subunit of ABC transporter with duplicated ATPase domains